jgi:Flp pilus assembly CpaE family ATPase
MYVTLVNICCFYELACYLNTRNKIVIVPEYEVIKMRHGGRCLQILTRMGPMLSDDK